MSIDETAVVDPGPEWGTTLREHFDGRLDLHWTKGPENDWVIVGVATDDASSTMLRQLTNELTAQMVDLGVAGFPLLYTAKQWAAVGKPPAQLFNLNDSRRRLLAATGDDLQAKRRLLLRAVQADSSLVDLVARRSPMPAHTGLRLAADAMKDALRWLFASWNLDGGVGEVESVALFAQHGERIFDTNAVLIHWQLEGLALQSHQLFLHPQTADQLGMWVKARPVLAATARFLRQFERHIKTTFTSTEERRQRRRRLALGGALTVVALVVLLMLHLAGRRPMEPVARSALKGKPGAISAEYFADASLLRRVVRRADKQIWIETSRAPVTGLHFDHFSARWRGFLFFPEAGAKVLCLRVDEGARLTLKQRRLFDNWWHKGGTRRCVTVPVKRGWYPLKIEYFDTTGKSVLQLERGDSSATASKIPAEHLCCKE